MATDLVTQRDTATTYLALQDDGGLTLAELLEANVGTSEFSARDLSRVTVPAGGGQTWTIPHPNGEIDTRELAGVVLFVTDRREYYPYKPGAHPDGAEAGRLAQCRSDDGLTGIGDPGGDCKTCPLAQFGSADFGKGKGQACSAKRDLYMLLPDRLLPIVVTLPSTSLKDLRSYMNGLLQVGLPIYAVETRLTLRRMEADGNKWSVAVPTKGADPTPAEVAKFRALGTQIKSFLGKTS